MSIQAVKEFLTKVNEDQKLQVKVSQAMKVDNNSQVVTKLAAEYGYEFTPDEFMSEIVNFSSECELSDEDLQDVAGGVFSQAYIIDPDRIINTAGFPGENAWWFNN